MMGCARPGRNGVAECESDLAWGQYIMTGTMVWPAKWAPEFGLLFSLPPVVQAHFATQDGRPVKDRV
jgi:hypothetical protein